MKTFTPQPLPLLPPPVITIVGRPNVGKSTLFNCLTESRQALVADVPGVTRDRQYGQGTHNDQPFIVIDTGGLVTQGADYFDNLALHQAQQALSEADNLLFMVDARDGLMAQDQALLQVLRHYNKPIYLVVNKIDGVSHVEAEAAFSVLGGVTAVFYTSTAHRRGVSTLIETVLNAYRTQLIASGDYDPETLSKEEEPHTAKTPTIQLAVVGRPNVGKSTFINRVLGEPRLLVSNIAGTTRDSIHIPLQRYGRHYVLVDTAGMRRRPKVREVVEKYSMIKSLQAIAASHISLVIVDGVEKELTEQDLRIIRFVLEAGKGLVIAVNKWDSIPLSQRSRLKSDLLYRLQFVDFADVHFISAKEGHSIKPVFLSINRAFYSALTPLSTPKLNRLLKQAVEAHPPPLHQRQQIKPQYAHPGGRNPPCIIVHGKRVEQLPLTYQRYLINFFRHRLKLVGTPVRLKLKNTVRH